MSLIDKALEVAGEGYPVFPCDRRNRPCWTNDQLVHRLIRNVHKDMKSANVFKLLESVRVNHSSVSVH